MTDRPTLEQSFPLKCWRHRTPLQDCQPCWEKITRESVFASMLAEIARLQATVAELEGER